MLFLILFLWQVPHFLAIAWIYREDYARAGLRMLPVRRRRRRPDRPADGALLPGADPGQPAAGAAGHRPGWFTWLGAVLLGLGFLVRRLGFRRDAVAARQARRVLRASLIYLPVLLALLLLDRGWSA